VGPLGAADRARRPRPGRGRRRDERRRRDEHAGPPRVRRAGAGPGLAEPAGRGRGDRQPGGHKAEAVRRAFEAAGISYRHLPAYSPDLNPIEPCWSTLKGRPRAVGARSRDALDAALGPALDAITAQDAQGWFRLAGYPAPN
jgi:hypothetical protein